MQEIQANAPKLLPAEIRNYLGKFLFSGDDVFKPVNVLSGGERGRLALAILALKGVNLIFLDEPTNHLDLPSQEILQAVLADFNGTILLVTHDRYLLEALATQIWLVDAISKQLQVFKGGYTEFTVRKQTVLEPAANEPTAATLIQSKKIPGKKLNKQKLLELETRIHTLEIEIQALEQELKNPELDPEAVGEIGKNYLFIQEQLDDMIKQWDEYYEKFTT